LLLLLGQFVDTALKSVKPITRTATIILRRKHRRYSAKHRQRRAQRRQTQPP
jgi:hypothetical protein